MRSSLERTIIWVIDSDEEIREKRKFGRATPRPLALVPIKPATAATSAKR
jgi:hypothetical protein